MVGLIDIYWIATALGAAFSLNETVTLFPVRNVPSMNTGGLIPKSVIRISSVPAALALPFAPRSVFTDIAIVFCCPAIVSVPTA
jgi:hypothetical protein